MTGWSEREISRAAGEAETILAHALKWLDDHGRTRDGSPIEETSAGTCWDDQRQGVA
jgi:hypothetical protein